MSGTIITDENSAIIVAKTIRQVCTDIYRTMLAAFNLKIAVIVGIIYCIAGNSILTHAQFPANSIKYPTISLKEAKAWCDSTALHTPEGIYAYPDKNALVLVRELTDNYLYTPGICEIVCIQSLNLMLAPGQVLGYISPTGSPTSMRVTLYTKNSLNGGSKPRAYSATYHPGQASVTIEMPRKEFSFNPLAIIPKLRRLFNYKSTDPARTLPSGIIRIYPPISSSASSSPLFPRYF